MDTMASQITSLAIVYSTVYSGAQKVCYYFLRNSHHSFIDIPLGCVTDKDNSDIEQFTYVLECLFC